jgi:WD40 repeat protein
MSDLFISYSRKDTEFVRKLHDALIAEKRNVWVDWEDIPPASDWHAEVFSGIEGADSFVFVISPDSVASKICGEEVEHALSCKKRVIPVCFREVDNTTMNPAISSHNYIFFRPTDDFDTAFKRLTDTFDTDLDYLKMHTRLFVRATEWDNRKRNPSFCLRGADLRDAEIWQISSVDKKPVPTALHHEYISASHKVAAARQRITIGALAFGFVVSIVLALFALRQSQIADQNATIALQNGKAAQTNFVHAESQRLLIQGQSLLSQNGNRSSDVAALLSIRSLNLEDSLGAENTLTQALKLEYPLISLVGHTDTVTSVAITPDQKYVVTGSADNTVRLWDITTGKEIREYLGHTAAVTGVAIYNIGGPTYIFSSSDDGTVREWDLEKGTEIGQLYGHDGPVTSVHVAGVVVVTTGADKTIRVWNAKNLSQFRVMSGHTDVVTSASVSRGGRFIATGSLDKTVRLWDVTTGDTIDKEVDLYPVTSVVLRSDLTGWSFGDSDRGYQSARIDLLPPDSIPGLQEGGGGGSSVGGAGASSSIEGSSSNTVLGLMPDGTTVLVSGGEPRFYDDVPVSKYDLYAHTDSITSFATSSQYIVTGSFDDTAEVWHIQSDAGFKTWHEDLQVSPDQQYALWGDTSYFALNAPTVQLATPIPKAQALAFSADSKGVYWSDGKNFELRDVKTQTLISRFAVPEDPEHKGSFAQNIDGISPDGNRVALGSSGNNLFGVILDITSDKVLYRYRGYAQQFSPDWHYMLVNLDSGLKQLVDLRTLQDVSALLPSDAFNVRFTADGKYIGYLSNVYDKESVTNAYTLALLDTSTGKEVRSIELSGAEFEFSPTSKTLLDVGDGTSPMQIIDIETGNVLYSFADSLTFPPDEYYGYIQFSDDGSRVLTSGHSQVEVFDTATGRRIRQFSFDGNLNSAPLLMQDNTVLLSSYLADGNITIKVPMDYRDQIAFACTKLGTDLTADDFKHYGITDSSPTCPQFAQASATAEATQEAQATQAAP